MLYFNSTNGLENVFLNTTTQQGIVTTNFGLKFQKIKIEIQKCLLLFAGVCPDVDNKAYNQPNYKDLPQIVHGLLN